MKTLELDKKENKVCYIRSRVVVPTHSLNFCVTLLSHSLLVSFRRRKHNEKSHSAANFQV